MVSLLRELFLSCIAISQVTIESATIFVALYNDIPDLNEDRLNSYKNLVEIEFEKSCKDKHKVQVVVDEKYDPYSSDLKKYLRTFDIIEIDAVKLGTQEALGSISSGCPGFFLFQLAYTNVNGMKDLWCSSTVRLLSTQI